MKLPPQKRHGSDAFIVIGLEERGRPNKWPTTLAELSLSLSLSLSSSTISSSDKRIRVYTFIGGAAAIQLPRFPRSSPPPSPLRPHCACGPSRAGDFTEESAHCFSRRRWDPQRGICRPLSPRTNVETSRACFRPKLLTSIKRPSAAPAGRITRDNDKRPSLSRAIARVQFPITLLQRSKPARECARELARNGEFSGKRKRTGGGERRERRSRVAY